MEFKTESDDNYFMNQAIIEAKKSLKEGGIPIGAVLVAEGKILGSGHNRLLQNNSVILHGEMDCIESAGRIRGADYQKSTLYTTLSPCTMCSGAIMLYKIHRVVIGENTTLIGPENLLRENGVEVEIMGMGECRELLEQYIEENPNVWGAELERVGFSTD
ncbi:MULTISPECIES: nucleoside deaminase [Methanobacterium]|jgi:cytosine deaminase|uniref:Nucleoside deaminase n=1 Tax=Methanobacterium subterraneum TaxID=59277 RepID=A0A2H4VSE9_9EURY|nr:MULTISPECIES: nucleoside deaminase [Methanobacterium]MBW4256483.1 nucleoside deaminase [Methanobacterium sp. YSL]PKL71657.1 MAG: tRNA-specific adenosine deaminase [Methanobacteriales archaeon HGW-Methanobacteriales-2]AUB55120.1 tRNA-specific adenosine deaminase [Methanobacterium subterraneum]AUB57894.1 tRNA-specific adenosine deaminase [Methanobacterium sp. MZ-A1]AUB61029.1 tRNA-specific adenosine deaminase [Methanobacterium subterraneum]